EGQNLQDCDLLINYDIHWNPVRIIQRFGRIDRIGSRNEAVHLVNFWPVADLDRYLNVKLRVEARMALVDLAATQSDNLLDPGQVEDLIKEDLLFRNRQLARLKEEILDLEDLDDSVSLTDFSLDEFRLDLLRYLQANRAALEAAGEGLYAVVPPRTDLPAAQPGVLFCLRHRAAARKEDQDKPSDTTKLNPLSPYYLVYVHDDGTVRFGFAQPKESMLLFRDLAAGQASAFEALCRLFDQQTKDGTDMSHYDGLLKKALASIADTFQRRAAGTLLTGRGAVLPTAAETPTTNGDAFDLVTWLVILQPEASSFRS
ncbi:MAG: C-terminal helicase domain-containing protein, partial [Verrucomicrobiales bacterium]|nr:C-terminal helicase domain-containing protein [Verrucomicrobiales bacterium]